MLCPNLPIGQLASAGDRQLAIGLAKGPAKKVP